jgi:glycosyltransferase involved in cell wall biosynthesis
MRVAMLTPMPPARTGVAHYASMLVPALRQRVSDELKVRLEVFSSPAELGDPETRRLGDSYVYQLGNNPHHEWIYAEAVKRPGVIVLHDLVLHHLIVEMTLARGDAEAYVASLEASHGPAGAAWARGRAAGLHSEMGNFLLPASIEIAQRSHGVIVHNRYAADRLRSFGVTTPISVVPHPYIAETRTFARTMFAADKRVIGFFGFLTSAKRAEVVLEAFRRAREQDRRLELLIVGEPAPNMDVTRIHGDGITLTGYVADDDFPRYYAEADRFVNLRYPTAGETSGTLIRALDAGKPVAVSDYAQFAELPDDVVFKVPLGEGEVDRLVSFFLDDLPDPRERQRAWLEENAALEKTIDGYLEALEASLSVVGSQLSEPQSEASQTTDNRQQTTVSPDNRQPPTANRSTAIPLFPQLELVSSRPLVIRNAGTTVIRTRVYGEPEYRLIVRFADGDRWLPLPKDLRPGEEVEIEVRGRGAFTLHHALQEIPMLDPEPWAAGDVR